MNDVYVDYFSYSLGERACHVKDSSLQGMTFSTSAQLEEGGFEKHHICNSSTTAYDLARIAADQLTGELQDANAIVYSNCIPLNANTGDPNDFRSTGDIKHLLDFAGSRLQSDMGMNDAMVIGLNQQACTGMLGSLRIARNFLKAEPNLDKVLCITADRFPEGAVYEQSYNLISDGAAACIVSKKKQGFRIIACDAITNGALSFASDEEAAGSYFNYSHKLITSMLKTTALSISDISWIVTQNMNRTALAVLSRLLRFDPERIYCPTLASVGHVISGDNIINLKHLLESQELEPGDKIVLLMAGYGLNWQSILLEKV